VSLRGSSTKGGAIRKRARAVRLAIFDVDGVLTDGDLRRTLEKRDSLKNLTVGEVMKRNPTTIAPDRLAAEAAQILEEKSIGGRIPVVVAGKLVGAITFHDLLAAKVV